MNVIDMEIKYKGNNMFKLVKLDWDNDKEITIGIFPTKSKTRMFSEENNMTFDKNYVIEPIKRS